MELERGLVRELRHDFRSEYHVCYDEVDAGEAVDLIKTLPRGSAYRAALDVADSWPDWRYEMAAVRDCLLNLMWRAALTPTEESPHVPRPAEVVSAAAKRAKSKQVKAALEQGEWEDV